MDESKFSTQELIDRCLAREERAWKEFLRRYDLHITRTCIKAIRGHGRPPTKDLVCDMKSETYVKLLAKDWKALRKLKEIPEKAIFSYLGSTAKNAVHDYYRDDENIVIPDELSLELPAPEDVKSLYVMKDAGDCLEKAMAGKPDSERYITIFKLYYWQGYSAREIAELHGFKTKAVENILLGMIKILRRKLNPGHGRA
jgi:RNA polymerase sigma factor (sigma-70 family)